MKKFILPALLFALSLGACSPTNEPYEIKFMAPSGAPTIAFYNQAIDGSLETNSNPSIVGAQLQNNTYACVVFDFYNGLKSIKNNNADYKLARIITGGNLYLVGIDKTSGPTADDYIVSFGEGLLPDLVYKSIYGDEIASATHYVSGVADCGAILESGLHNGNEVDYVLVAQPVLFAKKSSSPIKERLTVVASLRNEWYEKTGQSAIPQAGLFINQTQYNKHKDEFNAFFDEFEDAITTCIENPQTMKAAIESLGDADAQKAVYGFTAAVAFNVQKDNQNGFALVDYEANESLDIAAFLNALGKGAEDYSNYIM